MSSSAHNTNETKKEERLYCIHWVEKLYLMINHCGIMWQWLAHLRLEVGIECGHAIISARKSLVCILRWKVKTQLLKIPNQGVEGCKALFDDALMEVKREYDEVEKRKSNEMLKARTRAEYVTLSSRSDLLQHKKRKSAFGALERSFNITEREEVDKDCARMFYTGALSFNFVKNPYFKRFCLRLVKFGKLLSSHI